MMFVCAVATGKVLSSESWESVIWASMSYLSYTVPDLIDFFGDYWRDQSADWKKKYS